ncbi:MAG: glycosyltransferase [Nanoarchaeota archaeon]
MKEKIKITVIVPAGPDRKLEVIESLGRQKIKCNFFIEKGTNPSENRNKGIKKARTEFVAFVNTHSILPENWSEKVIKFFEANPKADIVGGPQLTAGDENYFGKVSGYALSSVFGAGEVSARYKIKKGAFEANEKHVTSANLSCRKRVFKKVLFDENIYPGEDPKFIADSIKAGFKVMYSPDIFVYHRRRGNTKELSKQIFNYGSTRPIKEGFSESIKKPLFLIPSIFVIYLAFFSFLSLLSIFFVLPLLAYILLQIIFSIYEGIKNRDLLSVVILPFIFFIIHIMYGIGFLYGSFFNMKDEIS